VRISRPVVLTTVVAVAAVAVATAVAATPTSGTWTSTGEGGAFFTVSGSKILPAGQAPRRYITAPSNFKCNSSNLAVKTTSIKIANGAFHYDGPAYVDVFRAKKYVGRLVWSGKFTTKTTVKGSYRFRSPVTPNRGAFLKKPCDSHTQSWTGKQGLGGGGGGG
jgi:hypothetical protein